MKKKLIIVAFLVLAQLGAFYLKSHAQQYGVQQYGVQQLKYPSDVPIINNPHLPSTKTTSVVQLLADETEIKETKTGARIVCSNDQVHFKLYQKWQHTFIRYSWVWKKDRHGPYKQYTISISKKDADLIKEWSKSNL